MPYAGNDPNHVYKKNMEKTFCCESLYDDSEECNWSGDYDYCNNQAVMDSVAAGGFDAQQLFSCGDHESVNSEGNKIIYLQI